MNLGQQKYIDSLNIGNSPLLVSVSPSPLEILNFYWDLVGVGPVFWELELDNIPLHNTT